VAVSTQLDQNKENVIKFYDLMFNECKPAEAIDKYAGEMYKMAADYSGKEAVFKRVIAEGNFVVLHCFSDAGE
jgi:predicted SnoaL-like aldol condensation-catalyzing enzyme